MPFPIIEIRTGPIPGNLKQCVMKITEFKATSGYSGLSIGVHNWFADERAYNILSEKAFGIYKRKVEADPYLAKYAMRICVWHYETDKDGIFRLKQTVYRDFVLIDGKVTLKEEQTFNK